MTLMVMVLLPFLATGHLHASTLQLEPVTCHELQHTSRPIEVASADEVAAAREAFVAFLKIAPQQITSATAMPSWLNGEVQVRFEYVPSEQVRASDEQTEAVVVCFDPLLNYVTGIQWLDRYPSELGDAPIVSIDEAQTNAETFLRTHCPFWTDNVMLVDTLPVPTENPVSLLCFWERRTETTLLRVSCSVLLTDAAITGYTCWYVPQLEKPQLTEAEAIQAAEAFWKQAKLESVEVIRQDAWLSPVDPFSRTGRPVWYVHYRLRQAGDPPEYEGRPVTVFVDAISGFVIRPTPADFVCW